MKTPTLLHRVALLAVLLAGCTPAPRVIDAGAASALESAKEKARAARDAELADTTRRAQAEQERFLKQLDDLKSAAADAGTPEQKQLLEEAEKALRSSGVPQPDGGVTSPAAYEMTKRQVALDQKFEDQLGKSDGGLNEATEQFKKESAQQRTEAEAKGKKDQLAELLKNMAPAAAMAACMALGGVPPVCMAVAKVISAIFGEGGSQAVSEAVRELVVKGLMGIFSGESGAEGLRGEIAKWPVDAETAKKAFEAIQGAAKAAGLDGRLQREIGESKRVAELIATGAPCMKELAAGNKELPERVTRLRTGLTCAPFRKAAGVPTDKVPARVENCLKQATDAQRILCIFEASHGG